MSDVFEYYISGGEVRIGKKELTLELLRKDSILRILLGFDAGNLTSMQSHVNFSEQGDNVIIDFSWREAQKLNGDPVPMLSELKARCGGNIGGTLSFNCIYTTFKSISYYHVDLDAEHIALKGRA